jgi:AraC-like DNA-binding protein
MGSGASKLPTRSFVQTATIAAASVPDADVALRPIFGDTIALGGVKNQEPASLKVFAVVFDDIILGKFDIDNLTLCRQNNHAVTIVSQLKGRTQFSIDSAKYDLAEVGAIAMRPYCRPSTDCFGSVVTSLVMPQSVLKRHAENLVGDAMSDAASEDFNETFDNRLGLGRELQKHMAGALSRARRLGAFEFGAVAATGHRELLLSFSAATLFPRVARAFAKDATDCGASIAQRARDILDANAALPLNLAEVARDLGVGLRALQQTFRSRYGLSLRDYLTDRRLAIAYRLLNADEAQISVADAALAAGFGDLALFESKFRARYGDALLKARRNPRH